MTAHHHYTIPCGLLLLAIGLFIRYHIGRRRFNRRGIGGLQQFSNYRRALTVSFLESIVLSMGNLCILAGLFSLAVAGYTHLKFYRVASLLWELFREGILFNRGFFLNLAVSAHSPSKWHRQDND